MKAKEREIRRKKRILDQAVESGMLIRYLPEESILII